jgi:uncharacterized RDD family membrane protein YckC
VALDDRVSIPTPEGLELELQLAGLGSRFIAGTVDVIIQILAIVALAVVTGEFSGGGHLNAVAFVIIAFLIWFGYPIAFEVLARGRTPGKRWTQLRVVRDSGDPVDLPASAIRNLVRLLDGPLLLYLPTMISIIATQRNQRPGDLAAGTLVIRESPQGRRRKAPETTLPATASPSGDWDVSAITPTELATVRSFLERRQTLAPSARSDLARRLADGLVTKVAGAAHSGNAEDFLETLVALKSKTS